MDKEKKGLLLDLFGLFGLLMTFISALLVFLYAPVEKVMGIAQKIFYFHVPSAFMGFLAFGVVGVASVLYLVKRDDKYDRVALSAAEIGVIYALLVMITGPIWARPVWGAWWTWEPRLTTTLILFLTYIGYMMLRSYGGSGDQLKRYAAVLGIVGFINVPLVYSSIMWWAPEATAHPRKLELEPAMKTTLLFSFVSFILVFLYLLLKRVKLEKARYDLESEKMKFTD